MLDPLRKLSPFRRNFRKQSFGTVLVTGASRGIGRELALALAPFSERMILTARSESLLHELAGSLKGVRTEVVAHTLNGFSSGQQLAEKVKQWGPIDTLVLNAAISENRSFLSATQQTVEREFGVNYLAPLGLTQSLLPGMLQQPHPTVLVVSSLTAGIPFPGNANYSATKAALVAWIRTLAVEHSRLQTCIAFPGLTDTEMVPDRESVLSPMSAKAVGEQIVEGLRTGSAFVVPGWANRLGFQLERSSPTTVDWFLKHLALFVVPGWKRAQEQVQESTP